MEDDGEVFKIITANRLRDGTIVYLHAESDDVMSWITDISAATAFGEHEIEAALLKAKRFQEECTVVDIYPTEVAGRNRPLTTREKIRARGPSIKYGHAAVEPDFSI